MLFTLIMAFACFSTCASFVTPTIRATPPQRIGHPLEAVAKQRVAVIDGPEWAWLQTFLNQKNEESSSSRKQPPSSTQHGYMTVLAGTTTDGDRVVGIQANNDKNDNDDDDDNDNNNENPLVDLGNGAFLYKDSAATVPSKVNYDDAISTMVASLTGIHHAIPKIEKVGGSGQTFVSGKVVVMGGNDYAKFCAEGLSALGSSVYLVTTRGVKCNDRSVQVLTPATGELELGFSEVVGEFDTLVDTMIDEARLVEKRKRVVNNYDDVLDNMGGSSILSLLKQRHKCQRYLSTQPMAQKMVGDAGVLFGPGKVKNREKDMVSKLSSRRAPPASEYQSIVPPKDFGSTVQTLLEKNVLFSPKNGGDDVMVRGWELQDFWESASWPRDSNGANVRYGLPVIDDIDLDAEMINEAPATSNPVVRRRNDDDNIGGQSTKEQKNPYVLDVNSVSDLNHHVLTSDKHCVLFMSASWCRTCKYLQSPYSRMARETSGEHKDLFFAKANTAGMKGKEIGKALDVDAVPTFVLFREGKRYGSPLSISRLPSKKLDWAVEHLASGREWDSETFKELEAEEQE